LTPGLSGNVLQNTTQIFFRAGTDLHRPGLGPRRLGAVPSARRLPPGADDNSLGQYTVQGNTVDVRPSKLSYFAGNNAIAVQFAGKTIKSSVH